MEQNGQLVSIIIPCFNAEIYLKELLMSLENQTYKNIQAIFVNDGSTDATQEILEEFKKNSHLKVDIVYQENQGVSVARNNGIKHVKGKYVLFLDSDDVVSPYFVEILVQNSTDNQPAYCYFSRNLDIIKNFNSEAVKIGLMNQEEVVQTIMHRKPPVNFFNFLYLWQIIDEKKLTFSEDIKYGEDNEFMWKYVSCFKSFHFINAPLYGYRVNYTSAMYKKTNRITESVKAIDRAAEYIYIQGNKSMSEKLLDYMKPRTKIALLKDFAKQGNKAGYKDYCHNHYTDNDYLKMKQYGNGISEKVANEIIKKYPTLFYIIIRWVYVLQIQRLFMKK